MRLVTTGNMPTIMTHAIVPLALAVAVGPKHISRDVAIMGAVLAILPDADVLGFNFGIHYGDEWGHRGATHSLMFALLVSAGISIAWKEVRTTIAACFLAFAMASHGLLDMFTDGGLGIALFWPYDEARHFAPATPLRVSPIGANFFSMRGIETLWSEVIWVWIPAAIVAASGLALRRRFPSRR